MVAVDTALFIYFIEEDPRFLAAIRPLFVQADRREREIVTSAITPPISGSARAPGSPAFRARVS
jgi:hypothetical protein